MLWSVSTVTDVARTQWLVRWGAIPADVDMFFIMFSSVLLPTGGLQYHTLFFCGWNSVDTSLGHWNKACSHVRIHVFKEAFKGYEISNFLPSDSSGLSVRPPSWFLDAKGCEPHSNVALEVYWKEPTCLRWPFSDFHVPFYRNKRLCKTMQYGRFETDPRYPMRRITLFRTAVAVVRAWYDFHESSAQLSPFALSVYRGYWERC